MYEIGVRQYEDIKVTKGRDLILFLSLYIILHSSYVNFKKYLEQGFTKAKVYFPVKETF